MGKNRRTIKKISVLKSEPITIPVPSSIPTYFAKWTIENQMSPEKKIVDEFEGCDISPSKQKLHSDYVFGQYGGMGFGAGFKLLRAEMPMRVTQPPADEPNITGDDSSFCVFAMDGDFE